jgi:hypothetical protein
MSTFIRKYATLILMCIAMLSISFTNQNRSADDFIDFTAYATGNQINVQWTLKEESNTESIIVERSTDGRKFQPLANLTESIANAGKEFIEADMNPTSGWSYYRIKQYKSENNESIAHSIPVYYELKRTQRGFVKSGDPVGSIDIITYQLSELEGLRAVFVLRNSKGLEFYHESAISLEKDNIVLPATPTLPAGNYSVTACSQNPLVGLRIQVR